MLRNSSSVLVDCDQGRLAWSWWYFVLSIRFGLSRSPHCVIVWLAELLGSEEPGLIVCSGVNSYSEMLRGFLADGSLVVGWWTWVLMTALGIFIPEVCTCVQYDKLQAHRGIWGSYPQIQNAYSLCFQVESI